jgi:serine/threonine protein kinase
MESPEPSNNHVERQGSVATSRYQIQDELGRGAMGAVYKAFDPVIGRTVALKTILIDHHAPDRTQMIERLKQEAKAAGGLDHPNIITIYDVGEENGAVYLSMQFVQGVTLAKLLEVGVPSLATLLSWADQILAGVGFAHARGVIHRDLKPANLMVTEQGTIKVLDFGIAKIENTSLTQTGLTVGTPGYMAPEQIAGKKVDHRADIFSLGAVFYELLTREKPFAGDIVTTLYKIVNEDPIAPSIINPAIPGGIESVVRKALAKDPKDRFQTCEEMWKSFLEQSVGVPRNEPARAPSVANRPPIPASDRSFSQREATPRRVWPRLIIASILFPIAVASWASYVRSTTGTFPPLLAKIASKCPPRLMSGIRRLSKYSTRLLYGADDQRGVQTSQPQNAVRDAPATRSQVAATSTTSGSTPAATLQPVAGVPNDDLGSELAPASQAPLSPSPTEISHKTVDPSPTAAPKGAEESDINKPTADHAATDDSLLPSVADHEDNKQSAPPSKPRDRKRPLDSPSMVEGFSRQDVPDLLRQADSYAARGNYRLARYEYGLVLKLDRSNNQAREGLRRLMAMWQER